MKFATIDQWLLPPKLVPFRRFRRQAFSLLDVGCGNHSAALTRRWFPHCRYHGVDRDAYNNDAEDFALMERFYSADLETADLAEIADGAFDAIVCAHVVEHLHGGLAMLGRLCAKLRPGGEIYVEFPGVRSLRLPSASGTLQFCDDHTHVRLYSIPEVANTLLQHGLVIRRAGTRRNWQRMVLAPIVAPASVLRHGSVSAGALWDLLGFADYVWAARPGPGASDGAARGVRGVGAAEKSKVTVHGCEGSS